MPTAHLFDEQGRRLFFNEEERKAFIETADGWKDDKARTFCSLLHYTGCNFTEAMNFTPQQVDCAGQGDCLFRPVAAPAKSPGPFLFPTFHRASR